MIHDGVDEPVLRSFIGEAGERVEEKIVSCLVILACSVVNRGLLSAVLVENIITIAIKVEMITIKGVRVIRA